MFIDDLTDDRSSWMNSEVYRDILTIFSQMQQSWLDSAYSTGGQWPKTYCKSNPGVFEVKEPDRGCIHLLNTKLKAESPTNKQLKTAAVKAWQSITKKETNGFLTSGSHCLQRILNKILKMNILFMIIFFWPNYILAPENWGTVYRLQFLKADDTRGNFLSNFARQLFLSNVAWVFSPLRMVNNFFLSGYFRSVVGPVSHLVAHWWQL